MTAAQKSDLALALRELATRIEADPGHLVGRYVEIQASEAGSAINTQKITVSLWFIKAARLARAGQLLFPT